MDADQRTETLVHKWKVQLEGRTRELEALQAKLVPQDLDMLRFGFLSVCVFFLSGSRLWSISSVMTAVVLVLVPRWAVEKWGV